MLIFLHAHYYLYPLQCRGIAFYVLGTVIGSGGYTFGLLRCGPEELGGRGGRVLAEGIMDEGAVCCGPR